MTYCGKCFTNRGTLVELQRFDHTPPSDLPRPEKRDHVRCPRVVLSCPYCQAERHEGDTFTVVHVTRDKAGREHDSVRQYPHVIDEVTAAKAA